MNVFSLKLNNFDLKSDKAFIFQFHFLKIINIIYWSIEEKRLTYVFNPNSLFETPVEKSAALSAAPITRVALGVGDLSSGFSKRELWLKTYVSLFSLTL
jgi:hypothetical protein